VSSSQTQTTVRKERTDRTKKTAAVKATAVKPDALDTVLHLLSQYLKGGLPPQKRTKKWNIS